MLQIAVVEDDVAASDTIRTYLNTILQSILTPWHPMTTTMRT